jgi:hypothetical protein
MAGGNEMIKTKMRKRVNRVTFKPISLLYPSIDRTTADYFRWDGFGILA